MSERSGRIEITGEDGKPFVFYEPLDIHVAFHESETINLLALGTRGTGKSTLLRNDAHARCLSIPYFHALIIRRQLSQLRDSHLKFINREMKLLGGVFLNSPSNYIAKYPNGSTLRFAHCETDADVDNFLSSEYGALYFDELSTFTLDQFLKISAVARAPEDANYIAVVRCASNPLGRGAEWMKEWFVDKSVRLEDYPDYNPDDFEMQFSTLDDNPKLNRHEYLKRLRTLPEHIRRAWLYGEFVIEGAYFSDFKQTKRIDDADVPWHVIQDIPTWKDKPLFQNEWLSIYRAIDWGYSPDPAVCLWIAVLPNRRAIVFKERTWKQTLAEDVARDIIKESAGMKIAETFCDPTMMIKIGEQYSIGELFEQKGVALTPSINDRALYGYSIHNSLNTLIDGQPELQILAPNGPYGCKELIRTIPLMRTDPAQPARIAGGGDDHWVVALAYFCTGMATPSREPSVSQTPRWMQPKPKKRLWSWLPN